MTATYWEIGRRIVECEQAGERRAEYGAEVLKRLSADLSERFGRGFSGAIWSRCVCFSSDGQNRECLKLRLRRHRLRNRFSLPQKRKHRLRFPLLITDSPRASLFPGHITSAY